MGKGKDSRLYTYRRGKEIALETIPDQFVVRELPEALHKAGLTTAKQLSSASSIVDCAASERDRAMDTARRVGTTFPAYRRADNHEDFLITDRVIVQFKKAPSAAELDAFVCAYGLLEVGRLGDDHFLFKVTENTGMDPVELVCELEENADVVAGVDHDLNHRAKTSALALPTDPAYDHQWHLHEHAQHPDIDPRASSRCEAAWQRLGSFGSSDVVVGITDDGCRLDHTDFGSPGKFAGWGYLRGTRLVTNTDFDALSSEMYKPGANHGTSCAGVVGADGDGLRTVGAAPACRLYPIQWESSGPNLFISDYKFYLVLEHLADKVDVVSNSWGIVPVSDWHPAVEQRIAELAQTGGRRGKGILFLFAAGNENCPLGQNVVTDVAVPYTNGWDPALTVFRPDLPGFDPDDDPYFKRTTTFANDFVGIDGVMHVAALASTAKRSHYSNYGPGIQICAPSSNVHFYRRLSLSGLSITAATGGAGGVTSSFGGTSSATPLVAGIAALVIAARPDVSAVELASILRRTASRDLDTGGYPKTPKPGGGVHSWDVSPVAPHHAGDFISQGHADGSWSPWFGFGRVDALAAVEDALGELQPTGFVAERQPDLTIPDFDLQGVGDRIAVDAVGELLATRVHVTIRHEWIGDLRVALRTPAGTEVVLHDRSGASTVDIDTWYDADTTPELASLRGTSIQGDWELHVRDEYPWDEGRLEAWKLELAYALGSVLIAHGGPVPATTESGPLSADLTVATERSIRDVRVTIDLSHPSTGDLGIGLKSPCGKRISLQKPGEGGQADALRTTWSVTSRPPLAELRGLRTAGTWKLEVHDPMGRRCKVNRWGLALTT